MDAKYCSQCVQKLLISSFLANASANPGTKVFSTCIACRARSKKRRALQPLHPNVSSKRCAKTPIRSKAPIPPATLLESRPEATILPPNPPESRPEATIPPNPPESRPENPIPIPTPPLIQPQAPGFLPADQWASIQSFNRAMEQVKMESCRTSA